MNNHRGTIRTLFDVITDEYKNEKLKDMTERVTQSGKEFIKKLEIIVKNETKKELYQVLLNIQQQFFDQSKEFKLKLEEMRQEIYVKEKTIEKTGNYLSEQLNNNKSFNIQDVEYKEPSNNKEILERVQLLKQEIHAETSNLDTLKLVVTEYRTESERAQEKVKNVDKQLEQLKVAHNKQIKRIESKYGKKISEILKEKDLIQSDFFRFKNKITQEMALRSLLHQRQQEFILSLYEELKNSKVILQNPTLRIKTYDKLKQNLNASNSTQPYSSSPIPVSEPARSRQILASNSSNLTRRAKTSLKYS